MQDIDWIPTKEDHKRVTYSHMVIPQYLGGLQSRLLQATSSNHAELLALHEASRECVWLRSLVHHIRETCGLSINKESPTILFEDNEACITQTREGYIKGDMTNHIDPKFFFTHELQQREKLMFVRSAHVKTQQICSQKRFLHPLLKNWYTRLGCVNFEIYDYIYSHI